MLKIYIRKFETYRHAADAIMAGLSPGARIAIGVGCVLFGVMMLATASSTKAPVLGIAIGVFCLLIAAACVTKGRVRQFIGSLIGLALFLAALAYLWSELSGGKYLGAHGEPSVLNAVLFLVFFGIPGLTYVFLARFGLSKKPNEIPPGQEPAG
jgi:hypothetical protein